MEQLLPVIKEGTKYTFNITLFTPNDFEPAFQKYAKDKRLLYNSLQYVLGIPGNSYPHPHSNDVIMKEQVYKIW